VCLHASGVFRNNWSEWCCPVMRCDGNVLCYVMNLVVVTLAPSLHENDGACDDDEEGDANANRKAGNDVVVQRSG
jgi:hypothetical protein